MSCNATNPLATPLAVTKPSVIRDLEALFGAITIGSEPQSLVCTLAKIGREMLSKQVSIIDIEHDGRHSIADAESITRAWRMLHDQPGGEP